MVRLKATDLECPHCTKPLTLHRSVSVDYGVSDRTA